MKKKLSQFHNFLSRFVIFNMLLVTRAAGASYCSLCCCISINMWRDQEGTSRRRSKFHRWLLRFSLLFWDYRNLISSLLLPCLTLLFSEERKKTLDEWSKQLLSFMLLFLSHICQTHMWWMQHSFTQNELDVVGEFLEKYPNCSLACCYRTDASWIVNILVIFFLLLLWEELLFSEKRWRDRLIWCCQKYKREKCWTRQKSCILCALKIIMQYSSDSEIALMHDKQQPVWCYQIFAKMLLYHSYTKETQTRDFFNKLEVNLKISAHFHLLNAVTFRQTSWV